MKELVTLFIDNIPGVSTHLWLRKTFSNYGVVRDAFIPAKRSSKTGSKFGFVRYDCSVSADMAILKANGMEVEDKKLVVKLADFVKRQSSYQPLRNPLHKPFCTNLCAILRNPLLLVWRVDEDTLKESSFAISKILIATKIHSKIEEVINLDIDGNIYLVRVSEVSSSHLPFSILSHSIQHDGLLASPKFHKTPMDVPILVFNSNEEDVKAEARLVIGDSVSNNFHQVVKDSLEHNAILRQEDSTGSRAIDSPSISASMVGETKEEVDCSMANDVGILVDVRHPSSSVGLVANSELSNSFVVKDIVLAVTNKDEEVANFDQESVKQRWMLLHPLNLD
ncbi:hypothetical protein Vadar_002504 [Vaccinium darrowii]|uniref:Uncharacterized protein n=1 Tax=Vaccinium darrowii TaxID=229202 RepID=A0ACB7YTJ1_9ERIC|nr:hypothetical protein Vadar_002504 [Vaccinium darrowii]